MRYKQPYLRPYKGKDSREMCPSCKKNHSFTLYLDGDTNIPINPTVGICNHTNSCGYHYTPKQYFIDNPERRSVGNWMPTPPPPRPPRPTGIIPIEYLNKSQSKESNFVYFLNDLFSKDYGLDHTNSLNHTIDEICEAYQLGATKDKRVIFWQSDINDKVRSGKIMQYDPTTGKRVHNASGAIDWIHNKLKKSDILPEDFNLKQCYFGEHLLKKYPDKTIAITEAEKTAIIASVLYPQLVWLGAGNLNGLTIEKSKVLKDRSVMLFPDASNPDLPIEKQAFSIWSKRANELRQLYGCKIVVSDILEKNASDEDKRNGLDIADYLIKEMRNSAQQIKTPSQKQPPQPQPEINNKANELEAWFKNVQLPSEPITISGDYTICEPRRYVKGAIHAIRSDKWDTGAFIMRLQQLKATIQRLDEKLF